MTDSWNMSALRIKGITKLAQSAENFSDENWNPCYPDSNRI